MINSRFDKVALEELRARKSARHFFRLVSSATVQHEFRGPAGQPSSYAFVKFECAPADDLSFESRASWPLTVSKQDKLAFEQAIAETIADVLLSGIWQHSGCAITLVNVREDEVGSSEVAFMKATDYAIKELLAADWKLIEPCDLRETRQILHVSAS